MAKTNVYTLKQIESHKTSKSLWIVLYDSVYDVTSFLREHPGGEDALLDYAGKDATTAFEDVGHSADARQMLKKYKIGDLADVEEKKINFKQYIPHAAIVFAVGVIMGYVVKRVFF